jgi:multidrug efflux pump
MKDVDNALYNAFGQRQVATIYDELNQYKVVMEVAPEYARSPEALADVYVARRAAAGTSAGAGSSAAGAVVGAGMRDPSGGSALSTQPDAMVPLAALATFAERSTPASVNHQDGELATTVSFNLSDGASLGEAQQAVKDAENAIGMPNNVRGSFQGTARTAQETNQQQPLLIAAALVVIYIVLGWRC